MDRSPRALLASLAVIAIVCGPAKASAGVPFLPHQALYELRLLKSHGANPTGAQGRIFYRFSGNACEGFTTDSRQVTAFDIGDDKTSLNDNVSRTWEDGEGKSFRFMSEVRSDDSDTGPIEGSAERTGDHITVKLKHPEGKTFTIDGSAVFPTEQLRRIVAAAKEGKRTLALPFFDGSDNGQKVFDTFAVIGQPITDTKEPKSPDPSTASEQMKGLARWPVTVSYFTRDAPKKEGLQMPDYSMSYELYENGVSRKLVIYYSDFVLAGALDKFDVKDKDAKPCK